MQGQNADALEPEVTFEILSDFAHQALEGQFLDQQFTGLLVTSDLAQCHCSGSVAAWLSHPTSDRT